jgi:cytochrome c
MRAPFLAAALGVAASIPLAAHALDGDATRGAAVYERCAACHSPDADRVGPRHRGVVGRRAGSIEGFAYSTAMKRSGVVWDEAALEKWLTDPQAFIPGQRMGFRLGNPRERADVIAYLKTLR